eukprot:2702722-Amphidinium_carterae.1
MALHLDRLRALPPMRVTRLPVLHPASLPSDQQTQTNQVVCRGASLAASAVRLPGIRCNHSGSPLHAGAQCLRSRTHK